MQLKTRNPVKVCNRKTYATHELGIYGIYINPIGVSAGTYKLRKLRSS